MSPETRGRAAVVGGFALFAAASIGTGAYLARDLPIPSDSTPREAFAAGVASTGTGTHGDGYARDLFGKGWGDTDEDGCDTRNEVLGRWLTDAVVAADRCTVLSGVLVDPYSGTTVQFTRGAQPQPVQIDHVVDLHAAYHNGADEWTLAQREAFANDTSNLLPTALNSTKGDDTPAQLLARREAADSKWLPSAEGECRYAQAYALVVAEHRLAVPEPDAVALAAMLALCP